MTEVFGIVHDPGSLVNPSGRIDTLEFRASDVVVISTGSGSVRPYSSPLNPSRIITISPFTVLLLKCRVTSSNVPLTVSS